MSIITIPIQSYPDKPIDRKVYIENFLTSIRNDLLNLDGKAIIDHGDLTGLADDDHSLYILAAGTRAFTGTGNGFKDEDDMASDSDVAAASQQSIKAYINNLINTAWAAWTPTVTQSGSVSHTANVARYRALGKLVTVYCRLSMTAAGTGGNEIIVGGLPVNIANSNAECLGAGFIYDAGTTGYSCSVVYDSATSVKFRGYDTSGFIGASPNFALASSDRIAFTINYEIA